MPGRSKDAYLLGIDVGTSSLKACLLDEKGKQVALSRASYRYFSPRSGWAQIDADSLWNALVRCVRSLGEEQSALLSRVRGIGLSVLCPALVLMDEEGNALEDPIPYSDRRSAKEAEEILEKVGADRLFAITANGAMAGGLSGSSLLWLRKNKPDSFVRARWMGHLNSWLLLRMTGQTAIDPTNASYTNLFDTAGGFRWSEELCHALEADPSRLPPLRHSFEPAGSLICEELTALGLEKGIPVAAGAGDTTCAVLAAGVTKAGDVCESVGTTNVLTVCVDRPVFDPRFINRCHLVPGTWTYQGSMSFTGASNEWFCRAFYGEGKETGPEDLVCSNREAASAAAGCGGVIFLPYMQGERSPVWDPYARGVFFGMTLRTTRADMARAVLESCGYGLRQFLEIAEDLTGQTIGSFTSIGGGSRSAVWAQIKADITGRTIEVPDLAEPAAAGAALLGGVAAGMWPDLQTASDAVERPIWRVFKPDLSHAEVYERNYRAYLGLYPALKELFLQNAQ
jgi:xylulokinase